MGSSAFGPPCAAVMARIRLSKDAHYDGDILVGQINDDTDATLVERPMLQGIGSQSISMQEI